MKLYSLATGVEKEDSRAVGCVSPCAVEDLVVNGDLNALITSRVSTLGLHFSSRF